MLQAEGAASLPGLLAARSGAIGGAEGGAEEDELPGVPYGRDQHVSSASRWAPLHLRRGGAGQRRPCLGLQPLVLAWSA